MPPIKYVNDISTIDITELTRFTVVCNLDVYFELPINNDERQCNILYDDVSLQSGVRGGYYNGGLVAYNRVDSNLTMNPEYRGDTEGSNTYTLIFKAYVDNYLSQGIDITLNITEDTIPLIECTHPNNKRITGLIDETVRCNLRDFYDYPFVDHLIFEPITIDPVNVLDGRKDYDVSLLSDTSNLNIVADVRDMEYTVSVRAYDERFKNVNNDYNQDFTITIEEQPPIVLSDDTPFDISD